MTSKATRGAAPLTAAGAQFAQSLNVLTWFRTHPNGTFMQASSQLGLSVPQIKHELHKLSFCGLPGYLPGQLVEVSLDKTTATISYAAGLDRPLALTTMEAGVLLFNLEALRSVLPTDSYADVDSVTAKLRNLLRTQRDTWADPEALAEVARNTSAEGRTEAEVREAQYVAQLQRAITDRRNISADYHSLSSDSVTRRTWTPDHLALINGETYLWGREEGREQRTYAVNRMSNLELGEPGSAGPVQQPQVDGDDPFNFGKQEDWAQLQLSQQVAWMLEYYPMWLVEEAAAAQDEGSTVVTLPDTGAWVERFCVAYAHDIEVLEPIGLKDRVRLRARNGLAAYSD